MSAFYYTCILIIHSDMQGKNGKSIIYTGSEEWERNCLFKISGGNKSLVNA